MPGREVRVAILGDSRDFSRAVDAADRDASRLDGALGRVGGAAGRLGSAVALGVGGLAVAGGAAALSFIHAAEESQQVTRQTDAVLRSMGATAWTTADAVAALSTRLSNQTGIDDELIQSGQNVLLTFGNVQNRVGEGNDIFDRATEAALNMSVALGTDMSSASMQVGQALNDPIAGLTRLRRSGIQFTEQQTEQITAMQEAGDMAGAQAEMLAELERQFGGSAAAQSTATSRMSTMWGNLQEQLGEHLLPIFERVTAWMGRVLPGVVNRVVSVVERVGAVISEFWNALTTGFSEDEGTGVERFAFHIRDIVSWIAQNAPPVLRTFRDAIAEVVEKAIEFGGWIVEHKPILIGLATAIGVGLVAAFTAWALAAAEAAIATLAAAAPVIAIGLAIAALVAGIIWAYQNWGWFRDAVDAVASFMTDTLWPALQRVGAWIMDTLVPTIGRIIDKFIEWGGKAVEIGATIFRFIGDIIGWVTAMPGRISSAASGMWDGIKNAFRSAVNWLIDRWNGLEFRVPSVSFMGATIGGFTLGMPDIPRLHTGGLFQTPNNEMEGLAILQNGERVSARGSVGGSDGSPIQLTVLLDGRPIVDSLIAQNRMNGPIPIVVQAVA